MPEDNKLAKVFRRCVLKLSKLRVKKVWDGFQMLTHLKRPPPFKDKNS